MGRIFSECFHPDCRILFISNVLSTGCQNLFFPSVANVCSWCAGAHHQLVWPMFAAGLWCTWIFGDRNVSFITLGGPLQKQYFPPESFSSSCLMIWLHNVSGLILGDVHWCENCALEMKPMCLFTRAEVKATSSCLPGEWFLWWSTLALQWFLKVIEGLHEQIQSSTSFSVYSGL